MGKIWCDLRALFFQQRQPHRSHQILSGELGKHAWAKSGVICAPCFFKEDSRADHTREEFFGAAFVFQCYNWYVKNMFLVARILRVVSAETEEPTTYHTDNSTSTSVGCTISLQHLTEQCQSSLDPLRGQNV